MLRHIRWEGRCWASSEEDEVGSLGQRTAHSPCHNGGTTLQLAHVSLSRSDAGGEASSRLKGSNKQLGQGQRTQPYSNLES